KAEALSDINMSLEENKTLLVPVNEKGQYSITLAQDKVFDKNISVRTIDLNGNSSLSKYALYEKPKVIELEDTNESAEENYKQVVKGISITVDDNSTMKNTENNDSVDIAEEAYSDTWEDEALTENNLTLDVNPFPSYITGSQAEVQKKEESLITNLGAITFLEDIDDESANDDEEWYFKVEEALMTYFEFLNPDSILQENHTMIKMNRDEIEEELSISESNNTVEVSYVEYKENIGTCMDAMQTAYIRVNRDQTLSSGYSVDGIDCEEYKEDTTASRHFGKGTKSLIRATTSEEKEKFSKASVVIEIETELGDEPIYLGGR
ncbi:MAG: Unknown protein, partial [uncultured Sulfurovum sp.]